MILIAFLTTHNIVVENICQGGLGVGGHDPPQSNWSAVSGVIILNIADSDANVSLVRGEDVDSNKLLFEQIAI